MSQRWLPADHAYPERVHLPTGEHLRPIRAADVEKDYVAVMGSRERLWTRYGDAWGWPPAGMTFAQDREELERHAREMVARESFNYAIFDGEEARLLGCVYLDPPTGPHDAGYDVVVSWWVVDECLDTPMARTLEVFLPPWITSAWPFARPRIGP